MNVSSNELIYRLETLFDRTRDLPCYAGKVMPWLPGIVDRGLAHIVANNSWQSYEAFRDWPDRRYAKTGKILADGIARDTQAALDAVRNLDPERIDQHSDTIVTNVFYSEELCKQAGKYWADDFFEKYKEQIITHIAITPENISYVRVYWSDNRINSFADSMSDRFNLHYFFQWPRMPVKYKYGQTLMACTIMIRALLTIHYL